MSFGTSKDPKTGFYKPSDTGFETKTYDGTPYRPKPARDVFKEENIVAKNYPYKGRMEVPEMRPVEVTEYTLPDIDPLTGRPFKYKVTSATRGPQNHLNQPLTLSDIPESELKDLDDLRSLKFV